LKDRALWERFWKTRDERIREELILRYLWIADKIAFQYQGYHGVELEDLKGTARLGLVEAVDTFPEDGVRFEGWAWMSMRFRILAAIRKTKPIYLHKGGAIHRMAEELEAAESGEIPYDPIRHADYAHELRRVRAINRPAMSLTSVLSMCDVEHSELGDILLAPQDNWQAQVIDLEEIYQAATQLSPLLKRAFYHQHVLGLSLREAAEALDTTEPIVKKRSFRAMHKIREWVELSTGERG